jgi:hypothetical protein
MKIKISYYYLCNKFVSKFRFKEIEEFFFFFKQKLFIYIIFCLSNRIDRRFFMEKKKEEEKEIKKKGWQYNIARPLLQSSSFVRRSNAVV